MNKVFLCAYKRTPIGRYGGVLASMRPDDLAAASIRAVMEDVPNLPANALDEVIFGCANQAGEDNRNLARMAVLIAGLPVSVPALTVNRLCGSGMDAVIMGMRSIQTGAAQVILAGGAESMSRAPFVMPKAGHAFERSPEIFDTTIGWRFVNPVIEAQYGIESMPETAENLAEKFGISRERQDAFALLSQERALASRDKTAEEIIPIAVRTGKIENMVNQDEHPRETSLKQLAKLKAPFRENGTVTAGNSSGVNDGAAALILASERAVADYNLKPIAELLDGQSAGVEPRIMGIGPVPATQKLLTKLGLELKDMDIVELNEAFASQSIAVLLELGLDPEAAHVNPNGGAIALGHPLGMSGVRIVGTAARELRRQGESYALAAMCVGVGQGVALVMKRA